MRTRPAGSARVRRRLAGRHRPPARPAGVLVVDPDRRSTAVLVGLTLLALLVGSTALVVGALGVTGDGAETELVSPVVGFLPEPPAGEVSGSAGCGATTADGTWSAPDVPAEELRVTVLSADGASLATGPVRADGTWSVPLPGGLAGTGSVVLVEDGRGAQAGGPVAGC